MHAARGIVGAIKHSSQKAEVLSAHCRALGLRDVKVMEDVVTRWWSTYTMVKRLVYLKPALEIMAREGQQKMLTSAQWAHLEGLIALLSPFSCVQEFLEGEKYVTISGVPFLIHAIRAKIDTVVNNADGEFEDSVVASAIAVKVKFQAEWGSGVAGTVVNEHKQRGPRNRHLGLL